MSRGASQSARGFEATGFSAVLGELLDALPDGRCAVFVDAEGETIDLATRIPAFDARIAGAELALPLATAREACARANLGVLVELRFTGDRGAVLARRVGEGCDLVVVSSGSHSALALSRCAIAADALRVEAGLKAPSVLRALRVIETRLSSGQRVPAAIMEGGARRGVEVLGLRDEPGRLTVLLRADGDEEFVAVYDRAEDRWRRG